MKKRVEAAFREEGLENYQVPADLPIEAIAREVREAQESLLLKVRKSQVYFTLILGYIAMNVKEGWLKVLIRG